MYTVANMASAHDHLANRMKLEWTSKLNTEIQPAQNYRRTSIIGTIGAFSQTTILSPSTFPAPTSTTVG